MRGKRKAEPEINRDWTRVFDFSKARMSWKVGGYEALLRASRDLANAVGSKLTLAETEAANAAFDHAWKYLTSINKTDSAELTKQERAEFIRLVIVEYRKAIRQVIKDRPPY